MNRQVSAVFVHRKAPAEYFLFVIVQNSGKGCDEGHLQEIVFHPSTEGWQPDLVSGRDTVACDFPQPIGAPMFLFRPNYKSLILSESHQSSFELIILALSEFTPYTLYYCQ